METRQVTVAIRAVSILSPKKLVYLAPGDILKECVCVGPTYRFLYSSGTKRAEAFECGTADLTASSKLVIEAGA